MTEPSLITQTLPHPDYADLRMFSRLFAGLRAWAFGGWKPESMSWKTGCYIHAGLSGPETVQRTRRRGVPRSICINGFTKFPNGGIKHGVMCTERDLIARTILQRKAEDRFRLFATFPWALYQLTKTPST